MFHSGFHAFKKSSTNRPGPQAKAANFRANLDVDIARNGSTALVPARGAQHDTIVQPSVPVLAKIWTSLCTRQVDTRDTALAACGAAHHISLGSSGRAKVPASWDHNTKGVVVDASSVRSQNATVPSTGIVEGLVERMTRKDCLDDLAKTMMAAQCDSMDELGDLRIPRTLYTQIKLWACKKFIDNTRRHRFVLRCLYRFETLNSLVSLFKIMNPRPFGYKEESRLSLIGEFGKMMREVRRLSNEETESSTIPCEIVSMYTRVMATDRKFHEWACIIGPSLVAVKSETHKLADRIWELAVEEAKASGKEW